MTSEAQGSTVSVAKASPASPPAAPPALSLADKAVLPRSGDSGRVVFGRVVSSSGAPLRGVQLTAYGRANTTVTTDSSGAYRVRLSGDSVRLTARQLGFAPTTQVVDLRSRDTSRVDLRMEPSILQLNSVVVSSGGARAAEKVSGAPSSILSVSPGQGTPTTCWAVRSTGVQAFLLPSHLSAPSLSVAGLIRAQWINWPAQGRVAEVVMSIDGALLRGMSTIDSDTVSLELNYRGNGWTGKAVQRGGSSTLERSVTLASASDKLCKM
jgi:hypothetical protein